MGSVRQTFWVILSSPASPLSQSHVCIDLSFPLIGNSISLSYPKFHLYNCWFMDAVVDVDLCLSWAASACWFDSGHVIHFLSGRAGPWGHLDTTGRWGGLSLAPSTLHTPGFPFYSTSPVGRVFPCPPPGLLRKYCPS